MATLTQGAKSLGRPNKRNVSQGKSGPYAVIVILDTGPKVVQVSVLALKMLDWVSGMRQGFGMGRVCLTNSALKAAARGSRKQALGALIEYADHIQQLEIPRLWPDQISPLLLSFHPGTQVFKQLSGTRDGNIWLVCHEPMSPWGPTSGPAGCGCHFSSNGLRDPNLISSQGSELLTIFPLHTHTHVTGGKRKKKKETETVSQVFDKRGPKAELSILL